MLHPSIISFETYILSVAACPERHHTFLLTPYGQNGRKALKDAGRKLYIIQHKNDFYYVGEANVSIKKRMERGFTAYRYYCNNEKARNGYKGYKWIVACKEKTNLTIHVAVFDSNFDNRRADIEAIEGELVWLIRTKTGRWPEYQHEIHFNNEYGHARHIAAVIYDRCLVSAQHIGNELHNEQQYT